MARRYDSRPSGSCTRSTSRPAWSRPHATRRAGRRLSHSCHILRALGDGVVLEDGPTAPAAVRALGPDRLELVITEGRKRQVKRMLERVGHPVKQLERVAFGPLKLGDLRPGSYRRLTAKEIEQLLSAGSGDRRR